MRKIALITTFILAAAFTAAAQKHSEKPGEVNRAGTSNSTSGGDARLITNATIQGTLQNDLDVRRARVGDRVILKTTRGLKDGGRTVVEKGSEIVGRVTEVQQRTKENTQSRIGVIFENVKQNGLTTPITASIVSITNVAVNAGAGAMADTDVYGSAASSSRASSGGPLGTVGGLLNGTANTAGSVLNTGTQVVGGATGALSQAAGSTLGGASSTLNSVGGIGITNSASGSVHAGTVLSAAGKNIRLEKGTAFQLQLSTRATSQ